MNWKVTCIVPLENGKICTQVCGKSRSVSLLWLVGYMHDKVLIDKETSKAKQTKVFYSDYQDTIHTTAREKIQIRALKLSVPKF